MGAMTDAMLDWIEEEEEMQIPEAEQRFRVTDDSGAEWCLGIIREAQSEIQKWETYYADRLSHEIRKQNRRIDWMKHLLEEYFRTVPHDKAKTQENYKLPGGKLIRKFGGQKFDAKDPAFVAWLKQNKLTDYVEVKETAKWGEFKKTLPKEENGQLRMIRADDGELHLVTADGEILPGVKVTMEEDSFDVEVKKK